MRILVIAPHADDEIIGAGGMMARSISQGDEVSVCIVTRGAEPLFSKDYMDTLRAETLACHKMMGVKETIFLEFPSVMLEEQRRYEVNDRLQKVIESIEPDEVYIPHWGDMQKDHKIVVEAAMVGLRPKYRHKVSRIYAYETLSETGWDVPNIQNQFIPTTYVDISHYLDKKMGAMRMYASQLAEFPAARSLGAMEALARYRGATMGMRAAEAFVLVREIR